MCCVATLLALGAVMVFSCLSARASTLDIGLEYLFKHALWVAGGVAIMLLMSRLDYHWLEKHQRIIANRRARCAGARCWFRTWAR